jgi:hypothetical protein
MDSNKCFLLSGYALKIEADYSELSQPAQTETGNIQHLITVHQEEGPQTHHVAHIGGLAVAQSKEDAVDMAKEKILQMWPESDGWTIHSVTASAVPETALNEALDVLMAGGSKMLLM